MSLQKITRFLTLTTLFLIPIFPLIVVNSYFFPFITGKAFYFRILVELAFAGWLILAFWDVRYRPKFTPLTIGVTAFAVITLIAALLGVNPMRSIWSNFERMEGWLTILHLWMFFMAAKFTFGAGEEGKRMWHRWFNFSLVIAAYTAVYGFFQLFGWAEIHQGGARLDASLGNAAYFAVYMLMHTGIAAYMFLVARTRNKLSAGVYAALAVIFGFLIFQTQTRGTILGLLGGVLVSLALYALFARGKETRRFRVISAAVIGVIVLASALFIANRDAEFIKNSPTFSRIASISWKETATQARAYIWPMAIEGALERPIFGWGQENFNYIFNANYDPRMYQQEQWFDRAHSVYLDWFVAAGFVGLISYLSIYALLIVGLWKRAPLTVGEKSVLTGLIVGYAIHNVFVFDNLASYVTFFALLGFVGSLAGEGQRNILVRVQDWMHRKMFSDDAVEYVVAPVVLVALVTGLHFFNARPIQANTRLISALTSCVGPTPDATLFEKALEVDSYLANQEIREQIVSCTSSVVGNQKPFATQQAFFALASKAIQDQIASTPGDARMYVIGGSFMSVFGQHDQALALLEKANELTPRKQSVMLQLATTYLALDREEDAVMILKEAYEVETSNVETRNAYALGMVIAGQEAEARAIFDNDPEIFDTPRMAQAYAAGGQFTKSIAAYQKLIAADPSNIQLRAQLAQIQHSAGMTSAAIQTLQAIAKDNPELKDQVDAVIESMK